MKRWMVLFCCVALSAGTGVAQTVNGPGDDVLCSSYTPRHLLTVEQWLKRSDQKLPYPPPLPSPSHQPPYSYRSVSQQLNVLADGTRICKPPSVGMIYEDSSGRRRVESGFSVMGLDGKPVPTSVMIMDPVAGTMYYLDLVKRQAYRVHPAPFTPTPPADRPIPEPEDPAFTRQKQSLGAHLFENLPVEGTLTTTSGMPPGASQPFTSTTETWVFRFENGEFPMSLLTKNSNPAGQQTAALLHFSTAEPDPALFRVPDGWKVVEGDVRERNLTSGGTPHTAAGFHYYMTAGARTAYDYVVQEAPYSAERITERTNVILATHNEEAPVRLYRDSAGRTRVDRLLFPQYGDKVSPPEFSEITDPVDGVLIVLDPAHRIAHRFALGHMEQSPRLNFFSASSPRGTLYSEQDLGEDNMDGIPVSGQLRTWRTPAGVEGNDREYTQTSETWYSTKLKLIVSEKTHSTTDDTVIRLTHFSQDEPDHSLFEIPAGYTVVEEKAPVGITFVQP